MKKSISLSLIVAISSLFLLNSCAKDDKEVDTETQSVVDNAICERQFMAVVPIVYTKGINEAGIKKIATTCETFTILGAIGSGTPNVIADTVVDANGFYQNGPVTFQVDYGTSGCVGADGVLRTGKINITAEKRWSQLSNTTVTVDLVSFNANSINYSGKIKINKPDSVTYTLEVINGRCTNGTWNIDYIGTKTIKQIVGYSTKADESDDVISITGSSSGKNREGRKFTTNITGSLIKKSNCKHISSGTVDVTPDGFKTRTVDFGNGSCDDDATYTVNGQTISFKLSN
jgi:hypothetical protein